jgi:hypothetical protein
VDTIYFQVPSPSQLQDHKYDLDDILGLYRSDSFLAVKELVNTGAKVTLSSDWDVNDVNPFLGIHNSINRAEKSITIKVVFLKPDRKVGVYLISELFGPGHFVGLGLKSEIRTRTRT